MRRVGCASGRPEVVTASGNQGRGDGEGAHDDRTHRALRRQWDALVLPPNAPIGAGTGHLRPAGTPPHRVVWACPSLQAKEGVWGVVLEHLLVRADQLLIGRRSA